MNLHFNPLWGYFDEQGRWHHNPLLAMPAEEQLLDNMARGVFRPGQIVDNVSVGTMVFHATPNKDTTVTTGQTIEGMLADLRQATDLLLGLQSDIAELRAQEAETIRRVDELQRGIDSAIFALRKLAPPGSAWGSQRAPEPGPMMR